MTDNEGQSWSQEDTASPLIEVWDKYNLVSGAIIAKGDAQNLFNWMKKLEGSMSKAIAEIRRHELTNVNRSRTWDISVLSCENPCPQDMEALKAKTFAIVQFMAIREGWNNYGQSWPLGTPSYQYSFWNRSYRLLTDDTFRRYRNHFAHTSLSKYDDSFADNDVEIFDYILKQYECILPFLKELKDKLQLALQDTEAWRSKDAGFFQNRPPYSMDCPEAEEERLAVLVKTETEPGPEQEEDVNYSSCWGFDYGAVAEEPDTEETVTTVSFSDFKPKSKPRKKFINLFVRSKRIRKFMDRISEDIQQACRDAESRVTFEEENNWNPDTDEDNGAQW